MRVFFSLGYYNECKCQSMRMECQVLVIYAPIAIGAAISSDRRFALGLQLERGGRADILQIHLELDADICFLLLDFLFYGFCLLLFCVSYFALSVGRLTGCALLNARSILIATLVLIVGHALVFLATLLGIKVLLQINHKIQNINN